MEFVDSSSSISQFLAASFSEEFKSFRVWKMEERVELPCLLIKTVGKNTVQLVVRADSDIEALEKCTEIGNYLKRNFSDVEGINIFDIDFQTTPTPNVDEITGKDEAWCYLRINYFEN
ncbi:hypothetical protein IGI57_002576 [Enterococcus sp. DIV0213j]|jgi:hypothetical protein|uniref:hypothetical protein n=1 Tax=Enterococcus sp. DIV0213j TaxID=2774649 RepID=UPI003D2DF684